ncbi:polysaccharide deacetylase family protein [Bacillus sp. REN10]|uniref:polysaccharide deacetylase family protein n=1 Tax=Bacillus sp. REN10 TaxID=2782541 RepID=UPI00193B0006|nr:polysaccharide deacetylase family protein [Bacillus sp. REN10]
MIAILCLIGAILLYTVGPTLFIRLTGTGIYQRGQGRQMVALTFDDGPDPIYTPRLLDLLEKYEVKATFFVVGAKARVYPEIIQDMHRRGHTVGVHNYIHLSNWLLPPLLFRKQLRKAVEAVETITGATTQYYRPPWGHFNLFSLPASKPLRTIMWTAIPGDWKEKVQPKTLAKRIQSACSSGAIITLHDSGTTLGADLHAPANTIEALELFLSDPASKEYQFVTIPVLLQTTVKSEG